jgi:hypothetical protein
MDYEVSLQTVAACPTAVVAQATTWEEFPRIWARLLDEVYAFLRGGGAVQDGQNVMLYQDDVPNVEVGAQEGHHDRYEGRRGWALLRGGRRPGRGLRDIRRCREGPDGAARWRTSSPSMA